MKDRTEQLNKVTMFGKRDTVLEAFEYARMVIDRSTDPSMNVYGTTALMVIWNTLAENYEPLTRNK
tara:strand:+ start:97 stop:294 length:198 start_codon:yes stop_codon:yes gene_type:complete